MIEPSNKQYAMSKCGFTLVELSIVLVIIGLLVGGISVGQSLIDSAKINRLVGDLRQYEIATIHFKAKYKKYPGDNAFFSPAGNANDVLDGSDCDATVATLSDDEMYQAFPQLSQAKMLSKNYVAYSPVSCGGQHDDNTRAANNAGVIAPYTELTGMGAEHWGTNKHPFFMQRNPSIYNIAIVSRVDPIVMLALENKMGVQPANVPGVVGLVNGYGPGMCVVFNSGSAISCIDSTAASSNIIYYVQP